MILIRFDDPTTERRALGFLAGRFSFKSWANGDLLVPDAALSDLALEGIRFQVQGPARHELSIPAVRDSASPSV
jgi:hypothetical protein